VQVGMAAAIVVKMHVPQTLSVRLQNLRRGVV
jgi:hypothetical protein